MNVWRDGRGAQSLTLQSQVKHVMSAPCGGILEIYCVRHAVCLTAVKGPELATAPRLMSVCWNQTFILREEHENSSVADSPSGSSGNICFLLLLTSDIWRSHLFGWLLESDDMWTQT